MVWLVAGIGKPEPVAEIGPVVEIVPEPFAAGAVASAAYGHPGQGWVVVPALRFAVRPKYQEILRTLFYLLPPILIN